MQNPNVIDLSMRRQDVRVEKKIDPVSDELENAIKHLIHQLRELGPLDRTG